LLTDYAPLLWGYTSKNLTGNVPNSEPKHNNSSVMNALSVIKDFDHPKKVDVQIYQPLHDVTLCDPL